MGLTLMWSYAESGNEACFVLGVIGPVHLFWLYHAKNCENQKPPSTRAALSLQQHAKAPRKGSEGVKLSAV